MGRQGMFPLASLTRNPGAEMGQIAPNCHFLPGQNRKDGASNPKLILVLFHANLEGFFHTHWLVIKATFACSSIIIPTQSRLT